MDRAVDGRRVPVQALGITLWISINLCEETTPDMGIHYPRHVEEKYLRLEPHMLEHAESVFKVIL